MSDAPHYALALPGYAGGPGQAIQVTSPYTDAVIATVETAGEAAIEQALQTAFTLFRDRDQWLSVPERIGILKKAIQSMEAQFESLARGSAEEGGKPLIDSRVEMARCIDSLQSCVEHLRTQTAQPVPMGINPASQHRMTMMQKEPIGVVVAISAFNHPLNLIAHQVGPAIASGCPVIVKPAETTPLSCLRLVEIFHQAGLPQAWCQALLTESHEVAEKLVTDSRVGFVSFIGSARVGWYLRSKMAPGTRCALEHGGVAPVIVDEHADLDTMIPGLAKGSFYHAGQVCVSVQRVYAHRSIAREVAERLAKAGQAMVVGDPLSDKTGIGPLIRKKEIQRVSSWVQEAVDSGAELICGGEALPNNCYAATVLLNPPKDARVTHEEIFGPVVCVYAYDQPEEALQAANNSDFAFQAAVYSRDVDRAMYFASRLDASAVMINEQTAFRVDWMPFAGLKHAGHGTGGVPYSMEDMQVDKMIVLTSKAIP